MRKVMFPQLKKHKEMLESNKEQILSMWLDYDIVQKTLLHHKLDITFYREKFASKVFNYAMGVIDSSNKLGDCPVMGVMLVLFKKKNIPLADVFMICVHLKNALLHFANEHNILDNDTLRELAQLMDYNFNGVIKEYVYLYYHDTYEEIDSSCVTVEEKEAMPVIEGVLQSSTTSALSYLQEIEVDDEMIAELEELESDTLDAIDEADTITQHSLEEAAGLFGHYAKVLNMMLEFGELEYTLGMLSELLLKTPHEALSEEDKNMITIYLKAIISDLQSWRMSVFITQEAEDIHYLDKTLMSSIAQLQITLMPQNEESGDEIEFF